MRTAAKDGGRYEIPAQAVTHDVGRDLSFGQAAAGEIPERSLAANGFVDYP